MKSTISRFTHHIVMAITLTLSCVISVIVTANDQVAAESLRKHLDGMSSLEGAFSQQVIDADGVEQDASSGKFMMMRPGKFYWETLSPMPQVLISNGKMIWLYDPDLETVNQRVFTDDLRQTPALLLSEDIAKLRANFSITTAKTAKGLVQFTLIPKVTEGLFQQLNLVFNRGDLVEFSIEDALGQITRCSLTEIKRNKPLAEEKFYFQVPPGVEVIQN